MKTSDRPKGISGHAARKSSKEPDQAAQSCTAAAEEKAVSVIHGAYATLGRARPIIKPYIVLLFFGALGALATGLVSYFVVVVPLQRDALSAEARSLATELDTAVRTRSSLISITAGNSELDGFLESGGLDKMLNALRQQFPDFLSFEAANDRGQVQAMGGELPLSQTSLFSKDSSGRVSAVNLALQHNRGTFHDDPENNCFFITCKHVGPEGGKWFTRSRFSRQPLVAILKSIRSLRITLVPFAGASNGASETPLSLSMPQACVVRTTGSWWRGPSGAEALLTMPGWLMRMEDPKARPIWKRGFVAVPLCLVLCAALAGILLRPAPVWEGHEQDLADKCATDTQSAVQDEKPHSEPEFCENADSLPESSIEMPLPAANSDSSVQSEAEFAKQSTVTESTAPLQDDLSGLTKIVAIPGSKESAGAGGNLGQMPVAEDCTERAPFPETLEVCWFEPCDPCETPMTRYEQKDEGTPLSDEERNPDNDRSPAGSHVVSVSG